MNEPKLKAYSVQDNYHERGVVVFAYTAGQARAAGAREIDAEFLEPEVRRAPEFDGLTPETLTPLEYIKRGWWQSCRNWRGCHKIADEENVVFGATGEPYCSETCRVAKEAEE